MKYTEILAKQMPKHFVQHGAELALLPPAEAVPQKISHSCQLPLQGQMSPIWLRQAVTACHSHQDEGA